MKIIYLREICKNNQPGADISHEHWGAGQAVAPAPFLKVGQGPQTPKTLLAWGRAPGVSLLGNIGLDCGWVAEISCGLKEIYF